jgi:cobalt-zinc-cadmium efflux system protein
MHGHSHSPDSGHGATDSKRVLTLAVGLTLGYALVELIGGLLAGSLALISDAGHMVTDSLALGMAAIAAWLARRPPSRRHSYGLGRIETLAAFVNALIMIGIVVAVTGFAVRRLLEPPSVDGGIVTWVALIGLLINIAVAWLLMGGRRNVNVKAALLHVLGDLLGSVAALVSGVVILYSGWTPIDPLLSLFIAGLILFSAIRVLREALHALLDGVPPDIDLKQVGDELARLDGVLSVHDLHIWSIAAERSALSAHVVIRRMDDWPSVLGGIRAHVAEHQGIDHVTLQPEPLETVLRFTPGPPADLPRRPDRSIRPS